MKSEFALICLLLLTALGRTPPTKPNAAMRRAADQILRHQTADGAITQGLPSDAASRIVPYFGNFAALGLVAAYAQTHHRPYLNAARNWIAWYEAHQNANGTIFDYTGTSGAWKPTGDFDSTDSYAATYLELVLAAYRAALRPPGPPILGGEIRIKASLVPPKLGGVGGRNVTKDWLRARHASVRRALAGIRLTLQPCGLTLAKPTYPVMYTMDNVETARGLRAAAQIAQALGDSREAAEAQAMAEKMAAAIARDLWDAARQSYRIGIQPDGGKMEGLEKWYPDVMANLMAIAWLPSPRHAAPYARLKTQFAADIPAAVRSEGDLDHLVWWGLAAQGAGDKELAAQIAARLADFDSSRPAVPNPALLGHICRILAAERAAGTDRAVLRHRAPTRNALPIFGRSLQVDPAFAYYQDRSTDSIAAEVRANGYRIVHYILTADSSVRPDLIAAFHKRGIGVWYLTFGNGTYSTQDLPNGWQEWKMVTRTDLEGKPLSDGYNRLCLNNPDYRAWKKRQITQMLRAHPFQGIDIVEPHWPEYPGAESPEYGCFCAHCLAAFRRQFPEETALPDILHSDSPRSPQRNPALWRKWLAFRQASLTDFLNDLVNGKDGIREAAPQAKVCVWTLALMEPDGLQHVREIHGEDAAEIARVVRPDLHCFQTHWPDWTQADLPPTYAEKYRPFVEEIRSAAPHLPLMIQADIGSQKQNRRSWEWVKTFERTCAHLGVGSTTLYEYFIGKYMYTEPPRLAAVHRRPGGIALEFTKRLDPKQAGDLSHYHLNRGHLRAARVDGSVVLLTLDGLKPGDRCELTVRNLPDDPTRRLFSDFPATKLASQRVRFTF